MREKRAKTRPVASATGMAGSPAEMAMEIISGTMTLVLAVLLALPAVGIDLTVLSVFGGALGVEVIWREGQRERDEQSGGSHREPRRHSSPVVPRSARVAGRSCSEVAVRMMERVSTPVAMGWIRRRRGAASGAIGCVA